MCRRILLAFGIAMIRLVYCTSDAYSAIEVISDTLRQYNTRQGVSEYLPMSHRAYSERFVVNRSLRVTGVRIWTTTKSTGSARIRIFGDEGGSGTPVDELSLGSSTYVRVPMPMPRHDSTRRQQRKSHGLVRYDVEFEEPIHVDGKQFFVCVDSLDSFVLLSDYRTVQSACQCQTELYKHQSLKSRDGTWKVGHYSFLIEPVVEFINQEPAFTVDIDTLLPLSRFTDLGRFDGLAAGDFDADGDYDLIANRRALRASVAFGDGVNRKFTEDTLVSNILGSADLVSTYRSREGRLHIVTLFATVSGFQSSRWDVNGFRGMRLDVPSGGLFVFSIAATLARGSSERVVIGERRSLLDATGRRGDRILVVDPSAGVEQSLDLPNGYYIHSAAGYDDDGDGDVDVLLASTDDVGRPFSIRLINTDGVLACMPAEAISNVPVEDAPQLIVPDRLCRDLPQELWRGSPLATHASGRTRSTTVLNATKYVELNGQYRWGGLPDGWNARTSSAIWADLDMNGRPEVILCSSDSCRSP